METKQDRKITSFGDIEELVAEHDLPIGGENENGEFVMICAGRTEEGLGRSYQVATAQENGWNVIHTYWEDGMLVAFRIGNSGGDVALQKFIIRRMLQNEIGLYF